VVGLAKVLCAYQGVPAPQNGCPALLLKVDDVVDVLSSDDDFWWEVSTVALFSAVIIWETGDTTNSELSLLAQCCFTALVQRISNCGEIQNNSYS